MPRTERGNCSICGEAGDGYHFGAEACRACAAFFRRSVALEKKYLCRGEGRCEIQNNIRCMCRACRFEKCVAVGMNPSGVQQKRDCIGKRDIKSPLDLSNSRSDTDASSIASPQEACSSSTTIAMQSSSSCETVHTQMIILERMRLNYSKMDNARLVIHRRDGQSLFGERVPRSVAYKEASEMLVKEVHLVADWISWCFDEFEQLSSDQKRILFRNFILPFTLLESAYLCHINGRSDVIILPSGDYIDSSHPEKFYYDAEEKQSMTSEEAGKMFKPSFEMHKRNIVFPLMRENMDVYEFFAMSTLIFWECGLEGQNDECTEIAYRVKNNIVKELTHYMRFVKKDEEPTLRVANLLLVLPALQRSVRRFQEDVQISHVFNVYAPSAEFYDIVNGKF